MSKPMLALFQDPKNPHKRKRIGQTPVGLKNIGNTCWFSAVIQVGLGLEVGLGHWQHLLVHTGRARGRNGVIQVGLGVRVKLGH